MSQPQDDARNAHERDIEATSNSGEEVIRQSSSLNKTSEPGKNFSGDLYSNLFSRRRAVESGATPVPPLVESNHPTKSPGSPCHAPLVESVQVEGSPEHDGSSPKGEAADDRSVISESLQGDEEIVGSISAALDSIEHEINDALAECSPSTASPSATAPFFPTASSTRRTAEPQGLRRFELDRDSEASPILSPTPPVTLRDTGLTLAQLGDLLLKQLYLDGVLTGYDAASRMRLPFGIVDSALQHLRDTRLAEVTSGEMFGRLSFRFQLTEAGRSQARDAFEQCRYVGPAPVTLRSYVEQCRRQTISKVHCNSESLRRAFAGQIVRPGLLDEIGPAICTGQAIFLHGPPGNGKTVIARRLGKFLHEQAGEIYVPYALLVDSSIITVFDPVLHQTTDDAELQAAENERQYGSTDPSGYGSSGNVDLRWRRIRRPVVTTAGELTLDMLDLRYHTASNYYTAPSHIKANGGVFLLDDFGRQQMSPRDLLNRWILPLEERIDYLTLATGKKFSVPFEQLVIFSTNLNPAELVDDAFLRRIRHCIAVGPPSRDLFRQIFQVCCEQRQIPYDESIVRYLFTNHYSLARPPRWSDPRDLLEIIEGICRFREVAMSLEDTLVAEASRRFFQPH
ncbi:MAG: ATPase [Planctomycetaceae bacterium]